MNNVPLKTDFLVFAPLHTFFSKFHLYFEIHIVSANTPV